MNDKDITEKTLESYNDVFADIVNGLLFDGEEIIKEDELEAESETSMYKAEGKLHEQERDVAKFWKNKKIRIALFGMENQTAVDDKMPIRVMGYDGASYRNQLNQKNESFYPVITLVLYFGDSSWNKPKNLLDCIDVPEKLKPYVNDYKINLFEICKLSDEQISKFKSDFKIVAHYFAKRNKVPDYHGTKKTIKHVDEFFKLMQAISHDNSFETVYNESIVTEGGPIMDEFLTRLKATSRDEGKIEGQAKIIQNLINFGKLTVEQISAMINLPVEKVQELSTMNISAV